MEKEIDVEEICSCVHQLLTRHADQDGFMLLRTAVDELYKRFPMLKNWLLQRFKPLPLVKSLIQFLTESEEFGVYRGGKEYYIRKRDREDELVQFILSLLDRGPMLMSSVGTKLLDNKDCFEHLRSNYGRKLKKFLCAYPELFVIEGEAGLASVRRQGSQLKSSTSATISPDPQFSLDKIRQYKIEELTINRKHVRQSSGANRIYTDVILRNQQVVAKLLPVLKEDSRANIVKELTMHTKYQDHPHVCPIYGYVEDNENFYLIMPLMKNGNLREHIEKEKPSLISIVKFLHGIASGMLLLHSSPQVCIHRDLNASNILLDDHLVPKISDFGSAKLAANSTSFTANVGSVSSTAPEVISKNATTDYNEKVDVWAFSMIIYELLSGKMPFLDCKNLFDLQSRYFSDSSYRPPIDGEIQQTNVFIVRLVTLMKDCWATSPGKRPTFGEILHRIQPLYDEICNSTMPLPMFWEPERRLRMICNLGDMIQTQSDQMKSHLEVGGAIVTGGDWLQALDSDIASLLTVKPGASRSVVALIRHLSNLSRHLGDKRDNLEHQALKLSFHHYVDQKFPELAFHIFKVLMILKADNFIPEK